MIGSFQSLLSIASSVSVPKLSLNPAAENPPDRVMFILGSAPHPEAATWGSYPEGTTVQVCGNARPLNVDECEGVVTTFMGSGELPDFQGNQSEKYRDLDLKDFRISFVNEYGELEEDVRLPITGNRTSVTALLPFAEAKGASKLCVLTTPCPSPFHAEITGRCEHCPPGRGFQHLSEGHTDCLLDCQCYACGTELDADFLNIAGYEWDLELRILNGANVMEDHSKLDRPAVNHLETHQFPEMSPTDCIRKFKMTLRKPVQGRALRGVPQPNMVVDGGLAGRNVAMGFRPAPYGSRRQGSV